MDQRTPTLRDHDDIDAIAIGKRGTVAVNRHRERVLASAPAVVVLAALTHLLWVTWLKWGNLLVDGGRELDLPRRMLAGEHLYRDLRFYYGPLAPFVNTALYGIFGVHVNTLIGAGIASAALTAFGIYRLLRVFAGRLAATTVTVAFLYTCAFAHLIANPSFNFVIPYTYSATYGMTAAVWCLFFLLRFVQRGHLLDVWASAACLVLASLAKIETLLPVVAIHGMAFTLEVLWNRSRVRDHAIALAAATGVIALAILELWIDSGSALWRDNLVALFNGGSVHYVRATLGLADFPAHVTAMLASALCLGVTFELARIGGRMADRAETSPALKWFVTSTPVGCALMLGFLPVWSQIAGLPLIAACGLAVSLHRARRERRWEPRHAMHAVLWAFAIAALARILFRVGAFHYGFYLVPVGLAGLGILYFDELPRQAVGRWGTRTALATGLALFVALGASHWRESQHQYAAHVYELSTPRGRLLLNSAFPVRQVAALSKYPPTTRVIVIPQGAGLTFFSGLSGGDAMFSYLPMEFFGSYEDAGLRRRWEERPPDLVVWFRQSMAEFGYDEFGVDYARRSAAWLRDRYHPVAGSTVLYVPLPPNFEQAKPRGAGSPRLKTDREE